jgi:hypothetical protein
MNETVLKQAMGQDPVLYRLLKPWNKSAKIRATSEGYAVAFYPRWYFGCDIEIHVKNQTIKFRDDFDLKAHEKEIDAMIENTPKGWTVVMQGVSTEY